MAEKDPIRLNLDADGNPDGFAEFQSADYVGITDGGTGGSYSSLADLRIGLGLQIGSDVQAYDVDLTTLSNLVHSDGSFIVSDGTQWVVESGSTARDSLGLGTGDSPTFTGLTTSGSVTIQGNLDVQGEFLNTTAEVIVVDDAFVKLNTGNSEVDAGIIVETSDIDDARIFYDVSTNRWVLGENQSYDEIITRTSTDTLTNKTLSGASNTFTNLPNSAFSNSSITVTDGSNSTDVALGGTITFTGGTGITLTEGSGTITGSVDFTEFDTNSITEGSTNLYFTNARADARITAASIADLSDVGFTTLANGDVLRYNGSSWVNDPIDLATDTVGDFVQNLVAGTGISVSTTSGEAQTPTVAVTMSSFDTDDLSEGSTNLYYTDTRVNSAFDTRLATKDTDDLSEGITNLYFTNERVDDRVGALLIDSTTSGIDISYDDINNQLTLSVDLTEVEDSLEDIVNGLVVGGTGLSSTYDDTANTLTLALDFSEFNTDSITEGSSNLYYTDARADARIAAADTDDLSEGISNLYYTDARSRGAVSVTDSGGDGSLSYNNLTGVFTYTGPSASEVRAHFSAGTGVAISSGSISIGQAVGTTDNVQFNNVQVDGTLTSDDITSTAISIDGDATITGDLTVSGTTTTVNSTTVTIDDPLVRYADNNSGNSVDFGFYGKYVQSSTTKYGGLVWDASQSDKFRLFSGLQSEPTTTVDITGTGYTLGTLLANIEGNLTGDVTGTVSDISNHDTDSLSEGSTNLYFTNERVDDQVNALLTAGSNITLTYDDTAGTLTIAATEDNLSNNDTDDLAEGTTNLYFTNERAQDALGTALTMGTQTLITVTYDDTNNNFDFVVDNDLSNYDNSTSAFTTLSSFSGGTNISFSSGTISFDNTSDLDMNGQKVLFANIYSNETDLPSASTYHGMFAHVHGTGRAYYAHAGNWVELIGENEIGSGLTYSSGSLTADFTPTSTDTITNKTINFEDNTPIIEFAVTVANVSGNKYHLDGETTASIQLIPGITYRFDQSDSSNSGHPLVLSTTKDGTHNSGSSYTTNVTTNGSPGSSGAYTQIVVNAATPDTLYYYCSAHSGMGGDAVVSVQGTSLSASDTDDLTEGSSNLYYTDARARSSVSVTDSGGDGSLSYNSSSGVFTYTGPSASEVRAHFSAGTGVTVSSGQISIGQAVGTTSDVTFNDLTVSGNLTVSGTTTTVNTETINLADNQIVLNSNYSGNTPSENGGIEINRGGGTAPNKTLVWNETDDKWTVGSETFVASTFEGNLTGNVTGTVSSIANHDTDALSEGTTNLYYTNARADARISTASVGDLSDVDITTSAPTSGQALVWNATNSEFEPGDLTSTFSALTDTSFTSLSNNDIAKYNGSNWENISLITDNVLEGTNQYHTAERVQDVVGGQLVTNGSHTGISFSYDDAGDGAIDATVSLSGFSTSDLSEGTNLYYTTARSNTDFDTRLATKSTTNLSEGTNLYFTNARADARIAAADLNDLNDVLFSNPTSTDDAKVVSYSSSSGGFVLSSLGGLSGSGEVNTASNQNTAGIGVFIQKTGEDLEFRGINAGSTKITVTNDTANDEIDIDLGTVSIADLSDVITTSVSDGQALVYSSTNSRFEPGDVTATLSGLTDTTITTLATSQFLQYNGTAWVNVTVDTDDIGEGSSNLYYTDTRVNSAFDTRLATKDTDDLSEGTTNLYYTDARVQTKIDSYVTGGTGVSVSSGAISIGQAVATTSDVTFNDLTVSGNLTVSGTTTTVNTETINLADNTITLNSNYSGNSPTEDGGIQINRGGGTAPDKTLIWNETTDKWTVGSETFVAGTFEGNATGITTAAITSLTEDTSPAETDLIVVYDGSANALKKVAKSNFAASVSFSVNDEMPLTLADGTSDPIEFTNVGTSATDLDLVLADGTSDPIQLVGTSNSATVFRDGDTDTFIKVEDTTDDDTIRMHTAGSERVTIDNTGVLDIASAKLEIAGAAGSADQVLTTNGSGTISWGDVSGGKILQVVQGELTSTTSSINETASPVDMGLSASITPSSTSSKILVLVNIGLLGWNADTTWSIQLVRGTTTIGTGAASSTRIPIHSGGGHTDHSTWQSTSVAGMYLDSPSTTSATTYKVQYGGNGVATIYINRNERDHTTTNDEDHRAISTITLMEVGA